MSDYEATAAGCVGLVIMLLVYVGLGFGLGWACRGPAATSDNVESSVRIGRCEVEIVGPSGEVEQITRKVALIEILPPVEAEKGGAK